VDLNPEPKGQSLLFVGGDNELNGEAIKWFIRDIFPIVRDQAPSARLRIAGRVARQFRGSVPEGVEPLGFVTDLDSLYCSSSVVVNPVLTGSGLAIKSIEALSFARPLVATSVGARGLASAIGRGLAVADRPTEFATAVIQLLVNPTMRTAFAEQARAFAKEWNDVQVDRLASIIEQRATIST
jgi:glycosyltransferase involved in cell wall biosynthesis